MFARNFSIGHLLSLATALVVFGLLGCASTPAQKSCCPPSAKSAGNHAHGHKHGEGHKHKEGHAHGEGHHHGDQTKDGHGCAACKKGKAGGTAWCDSCNVGYVNGKTVKCKSCFKGKSGENVWCTKCGMGFVEGKVVKCEGCYKEKTGGEPCSKCKKEE